MVASAPPRSRTPGDARVGPRALLFAAFCVLAVAYAAAPLGHYFSDSHLLVTRVEVGPTPYYNVAYVPLGWLWQRTVGAVSGWPAERALAAMSAVALAGAVVLSLRLMTRAGVGTAWSAVWTALIALAPGVLLHASIVEAHALQAFGALLALHLAWSAGGALPRRAAVLVAAAAVVALVTHLSHVLLLPGLFLLARSRSAGRGLTFGRRFAAWGLAAAAALALVLYVLTRPAVQEQLGRGAWEWAFMLVWFAWALLEGLSERGGRTPAEVAEYLGDELVGPAGVLVLGPIIAFAAWRLLDVERRSVVLRYAFLPLPAMVVFSQGGIWERGGYFLSYLPALALLGALGSEAVCAAGRRRRVALPAGAVLLLAAQAWLAPGERRALVAHEPEARRWAERVAPALAPGDKVAVASLAKSLALEALRTDVKTPDLARVLDMVPARARRAEAFNALSQYVTDPVHAGAVYLDAALWDGRAAAAVAEIAADPRVRLEPVAGLPDGFGLLRLGFVAPPPAPASE